MQSHHIDLILVPQGAEYAAVRRGLEAGQQQPKPLIEKLPIGPAAVTDALKNLQQMGVLQPGQRVIVMGLCGSLNSRFAIADTVLYQTCMDSSSAHALACDSMLNDWVQHKLTDRVTRVTAITSDRVICTATEKQQLAQIHQADIVDMEGFAVLNVLQKLGAAVAMLRVVSDDCQYDLPDLSNAIRPDGSLLALPMAIAMLRQPIAATRLIRGSLRGLQRLQRLTMALVN